MNVFISWSGKRSHEIALILKEWLPSVIQSIEPYVSSEDIDKGARWGMEIAAELERSSFGILCITEDNINAPWIIFEAGALSKTVEKSAVCPFLFDVKRSQVEGPLVQFQSVVFDKDDIKKLLLSINAANSDGSITEDMLDKAFEVWYPMLEERLNGLKDSDSIASKPKGEVAISESDLLEEILEVSRENQRLLHDAPVGSGGQLERMNEKLDKALRRDVRVAGTRRASRDSHEYQWYMHDILQRAASTTQRNRFYILCGVLGERYPLVYYAGMELDRIMSERSSSATRVKRIEEFRELLDTLVDHPYARECIMRDDGEYIFEAKHMLCDVLDELLSRIDKK